jgi:DNA polymerase III epsilon subunit-like protein
MATSAPDERPEVLISVDVETAGPSPSRYSMVSIGACPVDDPDAGFYVELRPEHEAVDERALAVSGLTVDHLAEHGRDPGEAMRLFAEWIDAAVPSGHRPVFVGFNAAFDWMFVDDYFFRHGVPNPFGHGALDIKSYYVGMTGVSWAQTSMRYLSPRYLAGRPLSHNALGDARDQAELFRAIRDEAGHDRRSS